MTTPRDEDRIQASLTLAIDSIAVPPGPGRLRPAPKGSFLPGMALIAIAAVFVVAVVLPFAASRLSIVPASQPNAVTTGPEFTFSGGTITFCGTFISYRPAGNLGGDLQISETRFLVPVIPDPSEQRVQPGLTRGTWVCVTGAVASSPRDSSDREMTRTTNLLRDFSLYAAPGTLSSAVSGSACGRISDISLSDVASGGSVTLGDARFQFAAGQVEELPRTDALKAGVQACVSAATFQQLDSTTFNVLHGKVVLP